MSIKQDSIRSFAWKLLERFGNQSVLLVVQIVMARILLPADFGMLAIMIVFIGILNCFVQSGLNTALIQAKEVTEKEYSTVFIVSFLIAIILFGVLFFASPYIAYFYDMPQIVWPLRILGLSLLVNAYYSVQTAKVTRDFELKKLFSSTIVAVLLSGTAGILLAIFNWGIWALVAQQVLLQLCSCLCLHFQIDWKPSLLFDSKRAKELFSYGWKLLASGLLDQAYQGMYDLIIGKTYSATNLGYFSQGKRFPQTIVGLFDGSLQSIALSTLSRLQDDKNQLRNTTRIVMKVSMFVIAPTVIYLAVFAPNIISLLLTDKWIAAAPFMQIMCAAYIFWPVHTSNLQAINAIGRSDIFLKLQIIKVVFGASLVVLVVVSGGDIYALAFCAVVASIISVFINAFPNKKLIGYPIREQILDLLPSLLLALIAGALAWLLTLLTLNSILTLSLGFLLMGVLYIGLSKLFNKNSFILIIETMKELFNKRVDNGE